LDVLDRDVRLVLYGIVIAAYITISYEIAKDLMKTPIDNNAIITTAIAGFVSLGVGIGTFYFLISKIHS
jgi:hypothetical protein